MSDSFRIRSVQTLYFAYGSNLNLSQMRRRCPGSRPVRAHFLEEHELVLRGVANIEDAPGSHIPGAIYEICESDEKTLDGYEGFPTLYTKLYFECDIGKVMYYRLVEAVFKKARKGYVKIIETGFKEWELPLDHLEAAIKTQSERYGQ